MKVAIFKDSRALYPSYEAYKYSIWFRIFGPTSFDFIACESTEEELIKKVSRRVCGKLKLIRITEIEEDKDG